MNSDSSNISDGATSPGKDTTTNTDAPRGWKSIKHFKPSEFDSPDEPGSGVKMNLTLVEILDKIRQDCGFPFYINSGYRSEVHNRAIKNSVEKSAHTRGLACDISILLSSQLFKILESSLKHGIKRIGLSKRFIHLDIDPDKPSQVVWFYSE